MTRIALRRAGVGAAALLGLLGSTEPGYAQTLAQRIAAAGDAEVRMTYPTRSGVCGDGDDAVAFGEALYIHPSMESYGRWSGVKCQPGDARVSLAVRGGEVEVVRTRVGGSWRESRSRVVDLGRVSAVEASEYFLALAGTERGRDARNALLSAVIADSADVIPGLLRLSERASVPRETRKRAVQWLGMLGDKSLVPHLERLARDDGDDDSLGEAALFALSMLDEGAGIPSLITFARSTAPIEMRRKAVFWLGQSGSGEARREVRRIAADESVPDEVRAHAAFSLAHGDDATAEDFAFLRTLFGTTRSTRIAEQILLGVSQRGTDADRRWLLEVARDKQRPLEVRKKAIFWAGQSDGPVADLVALYDRLEEQDLREHAVFVLSQREEDAATDKLVSIARTDPDRELRKRALFWLGQKRDPEVTRIIADMVTKP
jgi:HEAT repeat protein